MRLFPLIPAVLTTLIVVIIAAVHPLHGREMMLACEITGGITFAAAIALIASHGASTITTVQVALGATVGQMMLTGLAAVIVWGAQLVTNFQSFALWLLAFYWLELLVLLPIAIRMIRNADAQMKSPAVKAL